MRVAYISMDSGVPVFGNKGCSVHVQEVIRVMVTQGAQIDLFSTCVGGDMPLDLQSVRIHAITIESSSTPAEHEQRALEANRKLQERLERAGPFDLIYERYSLWSHAAITFGFASRIPSVLEVNAPLINEQASHRRLIYREAAEAVAAQVFAQATAIVAVSKAVGRYVESFPCARNRVHLIPNGVNTDRFTPSQQPSLPANGMFTVGFVGTFKPWHGLPVLIDAFERLHQRHSKTRLLIVGDGPERDSIYARLQQKNLIDAARLTGSVDPHRVPGLLASMDACVAPYPNIPKFYFSPLKVYEYMAAGRPVVASRIGQLIDIVRDGTTGLLCKPGNVVSLADKLEMLRDDPPLCRTLSQAARAHVVNNHAWNCRVQQAIQAIGLNIHPST